MPDRRSLPRVPDVAGDPSSQLLSSPVSAVTSAPSYLLRVPPSISVTSMDCPRDTGHRTLLPHGTCHRFSRNRVPPCNRLTWFSCCVYTRPCVPSACYGVYNCGAGEDP